MSREERIHGFSTCRDARLLDGSAKSGDESPHSKSGVRRFIAAFAGLDRIGRVENAKAGEGGRASYLAAASGLFAKSKRLSPPAAASSRRSIRRPSRTTIRRWAHRRSAG